jgi:hypothetical protein
VAKELPNVVCSLIKFGGTKPGKNGGRNIGLVLLGILAGQLVLYGQSFAGAKILLPLDLLAIPGNYLPLHGQSVQQPHNEYASDPVFEDEPARLFRNTELRAGRLPIWNPYEYAGVPNVSVLSPFAMLGALVRSPRILPWISLSLALVGGFGSYVFARRVLQLGVWPATVASWSYPITAFFVLWQSYSLAYPVVWLPWILCAIDSVVSGSSRWAFPALALTTMLTLVSGHLDMAGLVLIVSGLFAIWALFRRHGQDKKVVRRGAIVIAGWLLGFMLAGPELLHALEYTQEGTRLNERGRGHEERPPIGLVSLPQLLLPHIYGTIERDSFPLVPQKESNIIETPAAGFAGIVATLTFAPLAVVRRQRRSIAAFLVVIGFLGVAWCLNLPGIVWLMRLPCLNLLPYNRFVFATSFAVISLAAIGLETVASNGLPWHRWYYLPMVILAALAGWCVFRSFFPPSIIAHDLPQAVAGKSSLKWIHDMTDVYRVQHWFGKMYVTGAITSLIALLIWICLRIKKNIPRTLFYSFGLAAVAELLYFGYGRAAQCDPSLYYPKIPQLAEIARRLPGRVLGYNCLPASLLQTQSLLDVRGYDGVDPARYVELLDLAREPGTTRLDYAAVQYFVPRVADSPLPDAVQLPPILDLLGVRYLVCLTSDLNDYFVLVNNSALPRVFVPLSVELENNREERLSKLASPLFDPRGVAYVEGRVDYAVAGRGEARIVDSTPQRVKIDVTMTRGGLVVLADQWNSGWRAYIDEKTIPIVRVDHALSGVIAPVGANRIVFSYEPTSWRAGLGIASAAILILLANVCITTYRSRAQMMVHNLGAKNLSSGID